jgi:hypothetical protein
MKSSMTQGDTHWNPACRRQGLFTMRDSPESSSGQAI